MAGFPCHARKLDRCTKAGERAASGPRGRGLGEWLSAMEQGWRSSLDATVGIGTPAAGGSAWGTMGVVLVPIAPRSYIAPLYLPGHATTQWGLRGGAGLVAPPPPGGGQAMHNCSSCVRTRSAGRRRAARVLCVAPPRRGTPVARRVGSGDARWPAYLCDGLRQRARAELGLTMQGATRVTRRGECHPRED